MEEINDKKYEKTEDRVVMKALRKISDNGNDALVKTKKDGSLKVIELKMNTRVG